MIFFLFINLQLNPCTGTTDHIRPRADTASLRVTFTIDLSQKLTFPNTGIYLAAAVINKQSEIISEAILVKKVRGLESTLMKILKKVMNLVKIGHPRRSV